MASKPRIQIFPNKELKEKMLQNFQTDDIKEMQEILIKFIKNGDSTNLSLKDQILLERLEILKEQRPFQLRKIKAQADILESKRRFLYHFQTELSDNGSQTLTKSTNAKYGFGNSENYRENIQLKKNFFIDKHSDGSYIGVCKVCQNFTTAICTTSHEAEGDIELHLESVHNTGLYQK